MRWQQVGIGGVAHWIVERVEIGFNPAQRPPRRPV